MFKMRFFHSIICIFLFFPTSIFSQNWNLIWSDEFNSSALDTSKWIHDIGTGSQYGLYGWGNSELQYYQSQNTTLNNGSVKIIANLEPNGIVDSWNNTMYYSSSKITTKGTFDFRYGKVEASIKTVDGEGFWPAFWMLPTGGGWPCDGEIDIMEQWGSDGPSNITTGAAHAGTCPGGSTYQSSSHVISNGSYADNFHIYSIEWQPGLITWYVDNIQFLQVTPSSYPNINWPFDSNNWYLMFNLAITSSGPNSNTIFPSQIEIDWVRIYENIGEVSGCTDLLAQNYNPNATNDNGSCEYLVSFEVNLNCATNINTPSVVYITSPAINWDCNTYALNDSNSDGIWNGDFVLPNGSFEYIYCTDGWTDSESSGLITAMQNGESCAPITDYSTYANRVINITSDTSITNVCGSCSSCIGGCTSSTATNYNSDADYDDGSCNYSANFNVTFQVDMNNVTDPYTIPEVNGTFNNWCGSCWAMSDANNDNIWTFTTSIPADSYEYKFAADNWTIQEDLSSAGSCVVSVPGFTNRVLNVNSDTIISVVCWESCSACIIVDYYGCTDPVACNYDFIANVDDFSCILPDGCTDSTADNYDSSALCDDGSCSPCIYGCTDLLACNYDSISTCDNSSCIYPVSSTTSVTACNTYTWEGQTVTSSDVLTHIYQSALGCDSVHTLILIIDYTTTAYDTISICNDESYVVLNSVYTNTGDYADSIFTSNGCLSITNTNLTIGLSLNSSINQVGFVLESTTVSGGFMPYDYLWSTLATTPYITISSNGLYWLVVTDSLSCPIDTAYYDVTDFNTNVSELGIGSLSIYPNPSTGIFNITFKSEEIQHLKVRIMNVIGEELVSDNLEQFIGAYTKQINLGDNAKGIYFLEIDTNDGIIIKKLILL